MDRAEWRRRYQSAGLYWEHELKRPQNTGLHREHGREHRLMMWRKYESLAGATVSLSASTEIGQSESSIPVPMQQSYTSRLPVISSSVANTPCAKLGVVGLLEKLNIILGTSYTLEIPSLSSLLEAYIIKDYDFGTVYGHLRQFWYYDLTDIKDKLQTREAWDRQMRRDVLVNNKIINNLLPPRRVWDLFSNRVVPWWVAHQYPCAISHAWMKEDDRVHMPTPINGCEWPVPMPRDANLDLIRIEMLNYGAEYAWLDVLCLRQVGEQDKEDLRKEEWKLDVPTIGQVYRMPECRVVCYLSGLGRPYSLKAAELESDTCWFRRAWTLQEVTKGMIIGGDPGSVRFTKKDVQMTVAENRLSLLEQDINAGTSLFIVLSEMQKRVSTNPMDRVAGLSYLLLTVDEIPAYHATQSEEEAWNALVDEMDIHHREEVFFLYPQPGNGSKFWRPSWEQAMTEALPSPPFDHINHALIQLLPRAKERGVDCFYGPRIESGYVRGLSQGSPEGNFRQGELILEDNIGAKHTFKIVADHQYPISEGSYALVGSAPSDFFEQTFEKQHWVIGKRLPGKMFKKVSVFHIPDESEVERLHDLGIATRKKTVLA